MRILIVSFLLLLPVPAYALSPSDIAGKWRIYINDAEGTQKRAIVCPVKILSNGSLSNEVACKVTNTETNQSFKRNLEKTDLTLTRSGKIKGTLGFFGNFAFTYTFLDVWMVPSGESFHGFVRDDAGVQKVLYAITGVRR